MSTWSKNDILIEPSPATEKKGSSWNPNDITIEPDPIKAKIIVGETLSRSDMASLGVTERTSAQQRKVITDTLRRKQSPYVAAGMGGYDPRITFEDISAIDRSKRAGKAVARGVASVGSSFQQMKSTLLEQNIPTRPGPPPSRFAMPVTPERAKAAGEESKRLRESADLLWKVSKDPEIAAGKGDALDKVIDLTFETVPYITATTGAYLATGPLGGFAVGAMVEGNTAYRNAVDNFTEKNKGKPLTGAQEKQAKRIGFGVGLVSGAIEAFGGKAAEQVLLRAVKKIQSRGVKAGAVLGVGTVIEALEEGGQEVAQLTGEETYRDVNWKERVNRVLGSMAGGALIGGMMKGGSTALRTGISLAEGETVSTEKPPQVTPETEVAAKIELPPIPPEARTTPPAAVQPPTGDVSQAAATQQAATAMPAEALGGGEVKKAEGPRIISQESYESAKKRLLGKGTMRMGIGPQDLADFVVIGAYHVESGLRTFVAWSNKMIEEFGEKIKPHLENIWKQTNQSFAEEAPEEAQEAQAKLAAEAAQEIEPNLYIGNVTAGMKKRMSETGEFKPEDIKGFTEKGWPTKRTKVKMSRGEAEMYLDWLEKDLQDRVDNNKINTDEQIAMAQADWGDIAALRRSLGIPVGVEPFRVVYAQKPGTVVRDQDEIKTLEIETDKLLKDLQAYAAKEQDKGLTAEEETQRNAIEDQVREKRQLIGQMQKAQGAAASVIKDTSSMIYGAVQPSRLQESKMTVQEVLRAVMKRSARYAKMAYASGRRELRAELRAKARAKARMKKAVKTIKRPVPRTVDVLYREAIDVIKSTIDPSLRTEKTLKRRESLRDFVARNPEKAKDIPVKLIEALGKKSLNAYTIEELEQVATEIERLKDLGGLRRKLEISQYEKGKQKDLESIKKDSVPMKDREMIKPTKIGTRISLASRAKNKLSRMLNAAAAKWRSVATPMDVLFDMLDGTKKYLGANYRIFKKALDTRWSAYLELRDETAIPILTLARELGMTEGNFERIGVHAALQQDRGRQKLLDSGYTEEQIDEVKLTPEEMRLYQAMREKLDELTPAIEDVMHNVYNEPLQKVKNYFSFMTDFESMSDYEIREMYGDRTIEFSSELRKNVEKGFAITRTGGKQKIKINALEVFLQHTDNASYLIEMGAEIKRLAEIAATKEYGEAVGDVGQEEVRSWLDLMARKGRSQRNKTIPLLDVFRKHTGAAIIGFKLSSALVNATPLLDGAGMIGRYAFQGASDIAVSRKWRQFVLKNFPELRDRVGGDIEFLEFGSTLIEKFEKIGFWPLQKIDGLAASSISAGAYQKYLDEHGLKMDFETANQDAVAYAQQVLRRTQSSAFFKDVPSAFTRGTLTGNKSLDRLMLQFQSFMLNRWSLIEHDMIRSGIKTKSIGQSMNLFFWLSMAGFAEMGLRRLSKELIALLTGEDVKDWSETFTKEIVVNMLQNVPFLSQGVSLYNYGNIPVPSLSLAQDIGDKIVSLHRTKDPNKRTLKILELIVLGLGTATGTPGTMQVSEIIRSASKEEQPKRGTRAAREQRATRK